MLGEHRLPSGNAGEPSFSNSVQDPSYYDLALAVLPVPLLVGFLAGELLAVPSGVTVLPGAVASALVVGHLLFGNPPMRPGGSSRDPPTRRGPQGGFDGPSA